MFDYIAVHNDLPAALTALASIVQVHYTVHIDWKIR